LSDVGALVVSVTVFLELDWVLRGFYKLTARDVAGIFRALAGIEHVTLEDLGSVLEALYAGERGLDFAEAIHLERSSLVSGFAAFDRRLVRWAKLLGRRRLWNCEPGYFFSM